MTILQVTNLLKEYEGRPVLSGVTIHLGQHERVGIVGANGGGKSTLIKIIADRLSADGGTVDWLAPSLPVGYLAQEVHWEPGRTLGEQVGHVDEALLYRCGVTPEMLARPAGTLSGGQKVRAALAQLLSARPQVLLLDEPTNHLDTAGLRWLESLLTSFRGAVLVISHDRYFLDRVVSRVIELDGGGARNYSGGYSAYAARKEAELEQAREEYRQFRLEKRRLQESIRQQIQWAMRGHYDKVAPDAPMGQKQYNKGQAKAHMQKAKVMEKRLERIRVEKPRERQQVQLRLDRAGEVGRNLVLAENLGFTYDERRWLFRCAGFFVQRGDRVAVIGPNGAGKTTLLRLLLGQLAPSEGRLYVSPVRVAYLAQELETLQPALTVLEEATGNAALDQAEARSLLGCLLFSRDEVMKPVGVLSRGEKIRLAVAKILLRAPDLLVLDEPTNGLDLPSRERVEEALEGYPGTMLLVSHDRYLLRRLATRILAVDSGRLESFPGGYEAWTAHDAARRDDRREEAPPRDAAAERLLLEMQLARLSAALAGAPAAEAARLQEEFLRVSRALRELKR